MSDPTPRPRTLGIIAGSGPLPIKLAEAARAQGRDVFIVGIQGAAGPSIEAWPHGWIRIGGAGKFLRLVKQAGCEDIVFIGPITRPRLRDIVPDWTGLILLPDFIRRLKIGDDALLRGVVEFLERNGMKIVPAESILTTLLAQEGLLSNAVPDAAHQADIDLGISAALDIGSRDIGQGVVVRNGKVIALEDVKGTDNMLFRVAAEFPDGKNGRSGVLVKLPKPAQDRRVDLPTIGSRTVERAAMAGLAGIAVEAGGAIIADTDEIRAAADRLGLFVLCFPPSRLDSLTP
ncbi:MAG: UDP-2,3-diacylglucosamine diphosphatase LpxI [Parvibaculum sp.]|nr:UDP-2,3-diacylglucosamine diphosphatase LpxI [Parvibaculum sp.]